MKFDPFELKDVPYDHSNDLDKNFYNNIKAIDTHYYFPSELLSLSEKLHINSKIFSMIHANIRSAKKNFENVKDFFSETGSFFKVLSLIKTWVDNKNRES